MIIMIIFGVPYFILYPLSFIPYPLSFILFFNQVLAKNKPRLKFMNRGLI